MAHTEAAAETAAMSHARSAVAQDFVRAAPAIAIVLGVVCALASAQGGYFPTSWGWASTALLLAVGIWAISSGRSEIGRAEIAFVSLLLAFVAWIGLSVTWSDVPASSVLELERGLVPVSCVAAFLVLARRADLERLALAFALAIAGVACYALATRLFPDRLGSFDPFAAYRLADPIGYWNGLGLFCVVGLLAALAVLTGGSSRYARVACGGASVVLSTTLYFTYSRASWIALAIGFGVTLAVSSRRMSLLATTAIVAVPSGLAVLAASRTTALTHRESVLPEAVDEGRRLALVVIALALVAAALAFLLTWIEHRVRVGPRALRALSIAGWAAVPIALVAVVVAFGTPTHVAERAWREFEKPPPTSSTNLNERLFSLSGNGRVDLWRAAWDVSRDHPIIGSGAGTFERFWQARTDATFKVRDAHSLYAETLAELGLIGLALLVAALAIPLAAGVAARATPVVPALAGGYAAFLVHAGVDWDWELTGVTATALIAGCLLLLGARRRSSRTIATRWRAGITAVVLLASLAGMVGLIGNSALAHGRSALGKEDTAKAIDQAARARRLMPWSPDPWLVRGEAELVAGDHRAAAESFRRAIDTDAGDWRGWHDLAVATEGAERARALRRALSLYPRSSEIERTIGELRSAQGP